MTVADVVEPARFGRLSRLLPALARENLAFRRFFAGQAVSLVGDQVTGIALPLVGVLVLHAGAAQMGHLATAGLLPNLLFSLHAGAWVDRRGRRRQTMLVADVGRAILIASIPVAYGLGVLTLEQLYVVGFLTGVLSARPSSGHSCSRPRRSTSSTSCSRRSSSCSRPGPCTCARACSASCSAPVRSGACSAPS